MASTTYPSPQLRKFAGQIAWERGQSIDWSKNPTAAMLSGLIDGLRRDVAPLPVDEKQLAVYPKLIAACESKIDGFDLGTVLANANVDLAVGEMPEDRATANQAMHAVRKVLSAAEYRQSVQNYGDLLVSSETTTAPVDDVAGAVAVADDDDVPF